MNATSSGSAVPASARTGGLLLAVVVGIAVSIGLGVYGRMQAPGAFFSFSIVGFSSGPAAKAWLATIAFVLALVQLFSALVMYGRIPIAAPSWIGTLHRWSGRVAVLVTVPVAVHCLYALGFRVGEPRVVVHSLFGCFFYGAFVAKMITLNRRGMPGWSLPVFGGAVFTALTALWLTSSVWFFTTTGLTF